MTEIAVRQEPNTDVSTVDSPASDLIAWAHAASQAYQIATRLADTSFVPKAMQRRPDEVTGAILTGRELGLSPMAALRSIDVIDGTPAMRAHALRGLVQAHGHEIRLVESTDTRAVVVGRRRLRGGVFGGGVVYGEEQQSVWTLDRAKKANLAGKRNWQTYPQAMLVARATAEVCRLVAADVLLGMPYAVEELDDDAAVLDMPDAAPKLTAAVRKRTAKRATLLAAQPACDDPFCASTDHACGRTPQEHLEAAAKPMHAAPGSVAAGVPYPVPEPLSGGLDGAMCTVVVHKAGEDPQPCGLERPCPRHDGERITDRQRAALMAAYGRAGLRTRELRLGHAARVVGRPLASANDLTRAEAHALLDVLGIAAGQAADSPVEESAAASAGAGQGNTPAPDAAPAADEWPDVAGPLAGDAP